MIVFITGMPGAGKSTVAAAIAAAQGWQHLESDALMSAAMKTATASGKLLSPAQLTAWITDSVIPEALRLEKQGPLVVSGWLPDQEKHDLLEHQADALLRIHLQVPYVVLMERVRSRTAHIAKQEILDACWQNQEELYEPGLVVDGSNALEFVVADCLALLKTHQDI